MFTLSTYRNRWPQYGAQPATAALLQKTRRETPVLYAIMIYDSPIMTSVGAKKKKEHVKGTTPCVHHHATSIWPQLSIDEN